MVHRNHHIKGRRVHALSALVLMALLFLSACSGGASKAPILDEAFLGQAHEAVKQAYGEAYLPSMPLDEAMLNDIFGLPMGEVEAFVAEGPMMSTHVDTFIGLRAKSGKGESVAEAMRQYRDNLVKNSMQYPMNMPKVNASTVHVMGDHIFFLMLGAYNENMDATEEEALAFAQEQVKVGLDAIEGLVR